MIYLMHTSKLSSTGAFKLHGSKHASLTADYEVAGSPYELYERDKDGLHPPPKLSSQ